MKRLTLFLAIALMCCTADAQYKAEPRMRVIIDNGFLATATISAQPKLTANNIKDVVAAMTLEEKAALVVGTQRGGVYPPPPAPGMPVRPNDDPENNAAVTAFSEGRVKGAAGDVLAIPRLGIPTMVLADGPAGLRIDPKRPNEDKTYYCTAFPTASLLAATWCHHSYATNLRDAGVSTEYISTMMGHTMASGSATTLNYLSRYNMATMVMNNSKLLCGKDKNQKKADLVERLMEMDQEKLEAMLKLMG